jgi:hypothetical protein
MKFYLFKEESALAKRVQVGNKEETGSWKESETEAFSRAPLFKVVLSAT